MKLLRIKELQDQKGYSSKELAELAGVSPVTISNIHNEKSFPKPDLLKKFAEVFEVDIKELFNSTIEIPNKKKIPVAKSIFIEENGKYIKIGELKI